MTPGRWVPKRTVRGGHKSGFARPVGIKLHICCSVQPSFKVRVRVPFKHNIAGRRVESIPLALLGQLSRVDYRYIKRFLCKLFMKVVVFVSPEQCSTVPHRPPPPPARVPVASGPIIREKKERRKISEIYMPASTSTGLLRGKRKKNQQQGKYLFALLLAANVLPPREPDRCNYHVEEASKPTLRAAD
ncbi:hypothetical protein HBI65_220890 [Parastagonospora nodorum]|nr:hypothetical protein HBI65_220890 [Parastagonospora nodorum]